MVVAKPKPAQAPTSRVVRVTPDMAAAWLLKNPMNRPIRKERVREWQREMREGRWQLNGESIKFDVDGNLIDGQHRLTALVAENLTLDMFVTEGLPPEARDTLDQGSVRTLKDDLHMHGTVRAQYVSAASRVIVNYLEDQRADFKRVKTELHEWVRENPDISRITEACLHVSVSDGGMMFKPSTLIATVFLGTRTPETNDEGSEFLRGLDSGEGFRLGDPRLALRELLARRKMRNEQQPPDWFLAAMVTGWNDWIVGHSRPTLKLQPDATGGYLCPNIIGGPKRGDGKKASQDAHLTPRERKAIAEIFARRGNGGGGVELHA